MKGEMEGHALEEDPIENKNVNYSVDFSKNHIIDIKIENGELVIELIKLPELPSVWIIWRL